MRRLPADVQNVVTQSSGNHAQALSLAAKLCGTLMRVRAVLLLLAGKAAHIVMPTNAPACKQAAVRGYGGTITLCEPNQASREATANALFNVCTFIYWHADAEQSLPSAAMIPPFDYVDVSLQPSQYSGVPQ